MARNRITALTRYPSDPDAALDRACLEYDYCVAMGRIWFAAECAADPELWRKPPIRFEDMDRFLLAKDVMREVTGYHGKG